GILPPALHVDGCVRVEQVLPKILGVLVRLCDGCVVEPHDDAFSFSAHLASETRSSADDTRLAPRARGQPGEPGTDGIGWARDRVAASACRPCLQPALAPHPPQRRSPPDRQPPRRPWGRATPPP